MKVSAINQLVQLDSFAMEHTLHVRLRRRNTKYHCQSQIDADYDGPDE